MSAAATRRFVASLSVDRACACGATFTVSQGEARILCMSCLHDAAERVAERRRVDRERSAARRERKAASTCDECGTRLLRPAPLCNFCDPDFDLKAALAALDNKESPAATGLSATHGGNP